MFDVKANRAGRLVALCTPSETETRQIKALLTKAGYPAISFSCPNQMIENLNVAIPRVILFDAEDMGVAKYKTCKSIRTHHPELAAPIIFMAREMDTASVQRAKEAGIQGYLLKPLDPKRLLAQLDRWSGVRVPCAPAPYLEAM